MNSISEQAIKGGESLLRSEERFRLLVESVRDYAIFMLDPEGYVVTWNAGAEWRRPPARIREAHARHDEEQAHGSHRRCEP